MPNRREFLVIGLASTALPIMAGEPEAERVRCGAVIVETASPLALAFRAEAVKWGAPVHGIHDDITDLWYHKLDRQWKSAPATLAGITLSTSFFCLETFARDYGMRVWFRALHNKTANGGAERVMSGDERLVEQAAALNGEWGGAFARFALAVPLPESVKFRQKTVETGALLEEPGPMISWIIAPRLRNQSGVIS